MELVEQMQAELEGLKIVCASLCRVVPEDARDELRETATSVAERVGDRLMARPWTDDQLRHLQSTVRALLG